MRYGSIISTNHVAATCNGHYIYSENGNHLLNDKAYSVKMQFWEYTAKSLESWACGVRKECMMHHSLGYEIAPYTWRSRTTTPLVSPEQPQARFFSKFGLSQFRFQLYELQRRNSLLTVNDNKRVVRSMQTDFQNGLSTSVIAFDKHSTFCWCIVLLNLILWWLHFRLQFEA